MMDDDYFLTQARQYVQSPILQGECKKHGPQIAYRMGHRSFCPECVADYLEKAIGQVRVK